MQATRICVVVMLLGALGCGGGGGGGNGGTGTPLTGTMAVNAAASVGDLFAYTLDFDALTYSYTRVEGTYGDPSGGGALIPQPAWGNRVFATAEGDTVIVLPDQLVLVETDDGVLMAGVPQLAADYDPAAIAGRYNYVWWGGDIGGFALGTFDLNADGTFAAYDSANGGAPTDTGTWADQGNGVLHAYDGTNPATKNYNVMIHPAGNESILVVDDRVENGLAIGVRQRSFPMVTATYNVLASDADALATASVNGSTVTTPEGSFSWKLDDPWTGFGHFNDSTPGDEWHDFALPSPSGVVFGGGWDAFGDDWIWVAIQQ